MPRVCRGLMLLLCAWILWTQFHVSREPHPWSTDSAYETKQACERGRTKRLENWDKKQSAPRSVVMECVENATAYTSKW